MGLQKSILASIIAGLGASAPVLSNNRFVVLGDSRTAAGTDPSTMYSPARTTGAGYLAAMQRALGWRAELAGNFAINTETIQGLITREHAQGIATGSTPTWRAQFLDTITPAAAASVLVLIGVNNTNETVGTFGPRYDTLFGDIINAGFVLLICNELPNNNGAGNGAANFARRTYLDTWPDSSPSLTQLQKDTYRARRVVINTYDPMWAGAGVGSGYDTKAGFVIPGSSSNVLHPGLVGNLALGYAIAAGVSPLFSQFAAPALPVSAGQSGYVQSYDMSGTGGTPGTGTSGTIAASWSSAISSAATSAGFTCALSKGAHPVTGLPEQLITISGTGNVVGAVWNASLNRVSGTNVAAIVDGDRIRMLSRLRLVAGHTGILGVGGMLQVSGTGITTIVNHMGYQGSTGFWSDTMGSYPSSAIDDVFMTPPITLPTGWNSATSRGLTLQPMVWFDGTGNIPVSCTIGISQVGIVKI